MVTLAPVSPRSSPAHVRPALVLGLASGLSVLTLFPYVLPLIADKLPGKPIALVVLSSVLQSTALFFAMAWSGLKLGVRLGLDAPLVRALCERRHADRTARIAVAAALGLALGGVVLVADRALFLRHQPEVLLAMSRRMEGGWRAALASFYGGVAEEVMVRLFLVSALARLFVALALPPRTSIVVAVAVAAIAFAAAHLPAATRIVGSLDAWTTSRVLVLNGVSGVAFGLAFWLWGIEAAMTMHFCADLAVHVVGVSL